MPRFGTHAALGSSHLQKKSSFSFVVLFCILFFILESTFQGWLPTTRRVMVSVGL